MTIEQAAKHAGVHRTTINRSVKSGKLSAITLSSGKRAIDPAELERVFPSNRPNASERSKKMIQSASEQKHSIEHALEARITSLEKQMDEYRDRERRLLSLLEVKLLEPPPSKKKDKKNKKGKKKK
jgi:excisionase family DNA binding protein